MSGEGSARYPTNSCFQASVEPTYLIYINFYAASSLEMSARALQSSSPYRTRLLQQARDHYCSADKLIQAADESIARSSRPSSSATSSSMHSPTGSFSSRAWTNSTDLSSPAISIYSLEDVVVPKTASPTPAKKRVTFSLSEPIIRPDSPTLGFDDFSLYGRASPEPPAQHISIPAAPLPDVQEAAEVYTPESDHDASFSSCDEDSADPFMVDRSVHRYCGLLSSLRTELSAHLAEVEAELAKPSTTSGRATPDASTSEELRSLDLQARIERLRSNGWQRRRFDVRRYESLRENALAELA
jgi:hypothetical protein